MTTTPACPAAYIRVAAATTADDIRMDRQRDVVTEAARRLGWPQPVLYADTGPAAQPASTPPLPTRSATAATTP